LFPFCWNRIRNRWRASLLRTARPFTLNINPPGQSRRLAEATAMRRLVLTFLAFILTVAPLGAQNKKVKTPLDDAVDRGLAYLAGTQDRDGAWAAGSQGKNPAITALGVMAFMSAGHIPGEGKYGDQVKRGIEYVLRAQAPNGLIASQGAYEMYQHGICTLMLAEVVGMTEGKLAEEVRKKLERAVLILLRGQRTSGFHKGGWRYTVNGSESDISVTGWQVMALRAAKNVGCDVPPERIEMAIEYINNCHDSFTGGYRYMRGSQVTIACTGTSILALELSGKEYHRSPTSLKAGSYILKGNMSPFSAHYFYGIYYCSQAMFQLGDNYWNTFREKLHDQLFNNQNANGSWTGRARDDNTFGPSYCTSMAILGLTVEYRYLPIYQRNEEPAEEKK
jgi:hypothetical protein